MQFVTVVINNILKNTAWFLCLTKFLGVFIFDHPFICFCFNYTSEIFNVLDNYIITIYFFPVAALFNNNKLFPNVSATYCWNFSNYKDNFLNNKPN